MKLKFDIPDPQDYISPEIQALASRDQLISLQEYKELTMNSWEREAILPKLDNEALIDCVENCLKNISHRKGAHPCTTYDEALALLYAPELLKRLKG